jgi:predicted DsbA family dithiol-disulfide isomerase
MLSSIRFTTEVQHDINQAMRMGINGVPFFVFDEKYTVSGAQDSAWDARLGEESRITAACAWT